LTDYQIIQRQFLDCTGYTVSDDDDDDDDGGDDNDDDDYNSKECGSKP
jgi:hypothetical protein